MTSRETIPPVNVARIDSGDGGGGWPSIFIRVKLPALAPSNSPAPSFISWLPLRLLGENICLRLRASGVQAEGDGFGQISRGLIHLKTPAPSLALLMIKQILSGASLEGFASIYAWDERELFFRTIQTGVSDDPGHGLTPEDVLAESAALQAELAHDLVLTDAIKALCDKWKFRNPENPS